MCIGPKLWGTSNAFEARSILNIKTGIDITQGAGTQLSDGSFAFKPETPSGIPDSFHHGGKRLRRSARIETSTGDIRLYNKSLPASHASEPSHHQRSWVNGSSCDGISTECALKRFTVPGAPVEDVVMMSTEVYDEKNNDSNQTKQNIDMNSSTAQQAVSHFDNGSADALRLDEGMSTETCPSSTHVEDIVMPAEKDEKLVEEDEWYVL
jgi:hypothetical protein